MAILDIGLLTGFDVNTNDLDLVMVKPQQICLGCAYGLIMCDRVHVHESALILYNSQTYNMQVNVIFSVCVCS